MNLVILMGRLTRDPEVSSSASGTTFARYSIAVDRKFKREGEAEADFFNCTSFGKQAEFVEKYLKKGTKIVVSGEIQNNNYTNKDGQKIYDVRIMVHDVEFAESKNSDNKAETKSKDVTDFLSIPDGLVEELPFS
jgi:single-strand DNA-binding protein